MSNLTKAEALNKISKESIEIKIGFLEWTISFVVDDKTDTVVVSPKLKRKTQALRDGAEVILSAVHNGIILKTKKNTQVIEANDITSDEGLYSPPYGLSRKIEELITEVRFVTNSIENLTKEDQESIAQKSEDKLFELNKIYAAVKSGTENQK